MSTNDSRVNIYLKKFLAQQEITDNFMDFLQKMTHDSIKRVYAGGGIFVGGDMSSSVINRFDLSIPCEGYNNQGLEAILDPSLANEIRFENATGVDYYVAIKPLEIVSEVERNVKTGKLEYRLFEELIGNKADPDSVVDNGDGTLTIIVNSVTESGVSNIGRTVRVYLKSRQDGGALGPLSEAVPFEDINVAWYSSNNRIITSAAFGQQIGNISTDANDYEVVLLGPSVKRNTDLRNDKSYIFLGIITGDNGNMPSIFDQSDRIILSSLSPTPGSGYIAQILTLVQEGGTIFHDDTVLGKIAWSNSLKIRPMGLADELTINASDITLLDDEVAYVNLPSPFVSGTVTMQKTSRSNPSLVNPNKLWIFHRKNDLINVRGGLQLEQGEKRQLEDIVIGNSIFFSSDDKIRYDDATNSYHFDADGSTDNADIVMGTNLYFGDSADNTKLFRDALNRLAIDGNLRISGGLIYAGDFTNNDIVRFNDGISAWEFVTNNIARMSINEDGDLNVSRDILAARDIKATEKITALHDVLTVSGIEYNKVSDGSSISVNASLKEVYDETLNRKLLKVNPNNPADSNIAILQSFTTLADGSIYRLLNGNFLSNFPGTVLNLQTGSYVGGEVLTYTPADFTANPDEWFKYSLNLLKSNKILVIPATGFGTTQTNAPDPQINKDSISFVIVAVQNNSAVSNTALRPIVESNLERIQISGSGGGGGYITYATENITNSGIVESDQYEMFQYRRVQGNGAAVIVNGIPLGSSISWEDGMIIRFIGMHDIYTAKFVHNDAQYGMILNGDAKLGKYMQLTVQYDKVLERWIEIGRNY